MADPLSIAAGVAGLIGLSGQIFSGCLLAKSFLDDVKMPPKTSRLSSPNLRLSL
jgi:hypothetical protein